MTRDKPNRAPGIGRTRGPPGRTGGFPTPGCGLANGQPFPHARSLGHTPSMTTSDLSTHSTTSLISNEEQFEDYGEGDDVDCAPSSPCPDDETRTNVYSDLGSSVSSRWPRGLEWHRGPGKVAEPAHPHPGGFRRQSPELHGFCSWGLGVLICSWLGVWNSFSHLPSWGRDRINQPGGHC